LPSYLTDLLSLRLVGEGGVKELVGTVGSRINVRSSYSPQWATMTWI